MAVNIVHEEQEHKREMGHDKSAEVGESQDGMSYIR